MGWFARVFGKPAQISLSFAKGQFILACSCGGREIPFAAIMNRWPQTAVLRPYFYQPSRSAVLPEQLAEVRRIMLDLKARPHSKLFIIMDSRTERIVLPESAPDGFRVRYERQENGLRRVYPAGTRTLQNGWFLLGDDCWHYPALSSETLSWLSREEIVKEDLLPFLAEKLPALRRAGVSIDSEIAYSEIPALNLSLRDVQTDSVELVPRWNVAPLLIDASFSLPGHVLADNRIWPCADLTALRGILPDIRQARRLTGESVASFLDRLYPSWRPWITGDIEIFERLHRWAALPFAWSLSVQPGKIDGRIQPIATPMAQIGEDRVSVQALAEAQSHEYWHFPSGWARQSDLRALGLSEDGQAIAGNSSHPFPLTAKQLLYRGDDALDPVWTSIEIDGPAWNTGGDKHACAAKHLTYLASWGLSGGLTGGYEAFIAYGLPFLAQFIQSHPQARILVAGGTQDIQALSAWTSRTDTALGRQLTPVTYARLPLEKGAWDIVVLIEPDACRASDERPFSNSPLILAFYLNDPTLDANAMRKCASLLGAVQETGVIQCLVRNCRESLTLPLPHLPCVERSTFHEIQAPLDAPHDSPAFSIPEPASISFAIPEAIKTEKQALPDMELTVLAQAEPTVIAENDTQPAAETAVSEKDSPTLEIENAGPESIQPIVETLQSTTDGIVSSLIRSVQRAPGQSEAEEESAFEEERTSDEQIWFPPDVLSVSSSGAQLSFDDLFFAKTDATREPEHSIKPSSAAQTADIPPVQTKAQPGRHINLDPARLSQLRQDSNAIRDALLETLGEPDDAADIEPDDEEFSALPADSPASGVWSFDPEGLDDAWIAFFQRADLDALEAAMRGESALSAYAKARRQMPDVALDALNDAAQDTFGDLIVDEEGVVEEYREIVRAHLKKK